MREMKNSGIEWIGEIPVDWDITTYRRIFSRRKEYDDKDKQVLSLTIQGVKEKNDSYGKMAEDFTGHQIVKKGDLVFTPRDFDATPILSGIAPCDGCISNLYFILYPYNTESVYAPFYNYFMWGVKWGGDIWKRLSYGMRFSYNFQQFGSLPTVLPPISEQHRIADFLDEKCAKIDAVIEKQKQVIEKLKEYKFSVLYDLFLNGIDNEAIKWTEFRLGDIASYKKGPFGSAITISMFVEKANDTFKIYEQKNAIYKDATLGHYYINEGKYKELESFSVLPNDIIVSCAGTIGQCYILPENAEIGIINQALMRVRVFENYDVNYVCELLNVLLIEIADEFSNGSAIKNIPPFSVLKKYKIRIPDLKRQKELITYIKNEKEKIDSAIAKKQAIIEKLTEYKKSLIYEVVTGKREV